MTNFVYKILTPTEYSQAYDKKQNLIVDDSDSDDSLAETIQLGSPVKKSKKSFVGYPIYHGTQLDLNDGFIHFSTANQVPTTLSRFFSQAKVVHLLKIPIVGRVKANLVWEEPIVNGVKQSSTEVYPHLYASNQADKPFINLEQDVVEVMMVTRGQGGMVNRQGSILEDWDDTVTTTSSSTSLQSWSEALQVVGGLKQ